MHRRQSWNTRTACLGRQPLGGGVVLGTRSQISIVDMYLHVFIYYYIILIFIYVSWSLLSLCMHPPL
jgi:hypothetical protein